jgi:hypothetical protein
MSNIRVTHDNNLNNARSESSIVINPNNPMQIVTGSKKFNDYHNYDFVLATQYSTDGGYSWHDSANLPTPGFTLLTDPAMAWDDSGNLFLIGLAGTLEIYTLPVPGHQRTAVENLARMVTNGDESSKRLERLPPATQQIQ